jgi:hypothetical protein
VLKHGQSKLFANPLSPPIDFDDINHDDEGSAGGRNVGFYWTVTGIIGQQGKY